jgi:nitroreductase
MPHNGKTRRNPFTVVGILLYKDCTSLQAQATDPAGKEKIIMAENETIKTIKQRRSVRDYGEEQVSGGDLDIILEAGLYAPSGGGNIEEDIYFTIIRNTETLNTINILAKEFAKQSELSWIKELGEDENFNCLYNANTLIVISYKKDSVCAAYDCSAATQNMLLAAEALGLGGCWLFFPLQAFETKRGEALLAELKIPRDYKPITSMLLGHKKNGPTAIPERKTNNIVYIN